MQLFNHLNGTPETGDFNYACSVVKNPLNTLDESTVTEYAEYVEVIKDALEKALDQYLEKNND